MIEKMKTSAATALLVLAGLALAGCQLDDAALDDYYVPQTHHERYPIKVVTAPVSVGMAARSGGLGPGQINAIANFADQARTNSASRIKISYPSSSRAGRKIARDIAQLMASHGIPSSKVTVTSYHGERGGPIYISYIRKVAVTHECGDWSENLAATGWNESYPNFGCATQHNIAAMVSNSEDFETPRTMTPVWGSAAANRTSALVVYRNGQADFVSGESSSSSGNTGIPQ